MKMVIGVGHRVRMYAVVAVSLWAASPACAGVYVDNALGDVPPSQLVRVANPKPVQLLVEFDTGDKINARATKYIKPIVVDEVKGTGIVGDIGDLPVAGGARLVVIITDVIDKSAFGKGFATGFTFGLAGSVVADDYNIALRYTPADGQPPIERMIHHRVYSKLGLTSAPPNTVKVDKVEEAMRMVVRQAMSHGLNQIAGDPRFVGAIASGGDAPVGVVAPVPANATLPATVPATLNATVNGVTN